MIQEVEHFSRIEPEAVFKAMADTTRRRALQILREHELSVSELVKVLHLPQSTVSRHLKVLREAGLLRDRRDGTTVLYSVASSNGVTTAHDGDGSADPGLPHQLLEWIAQQPIPPAIQSRLRSVIRDRSDQSRRFFSRIGGQWDALREASFGPTFHLEAFLGLLPREWIVADVGAGTGYLLPILARHFARVVAVEPVETMLEASRQRIEGAGLDNVELHRGDLSGLPIDDNAVDLSVAVLVLHHVTAPAEAIAELHRVLRVGGRVMIVEQTPHDSAAFRERMQDPWWGFAPAALGEMLASAGFEGVESRMLVTLERADDAPELFVVTGRKADAGTDDL